MAESAAPAATAPEKPDFQELQRQVETLNVEIEAAKAKRERCQAKISSGKGSNDEINVSVASRRGACGCPARCRSDGRRAQSRCRPVHFSDAVDGPPRCNACAAGVTSHRDKRGRGLSLWPCGAFAPSSSARRPLGSVLALAVRPLAPRPSRAGPPPGGAQPLPGDQDRPRQDQVGARGADLAAQRGPRPGRQDGASLRSDP